MRTLREQKNHATNAFIRWFASGRFKDCCRKQVEGQVALVNGDNLKQIIEKLLGIIK
jgi:hypothetical protein